MSKHASSEASLQKCERRITNIQKRIQQLHVKEAPVKKRYKAYGKKLGDIQSRIFELQSQLSKATAHRVVLTSAPGDYVVTRSKRVVRLVARGKTRKGTETWFGHYFNRSKMQWGRKAQPVFDGEIRDSVEDFPKFVRADCERNNHPADMTITSDEGPLLCYCGAKQYVGTEAAVPLVAAEV